MPTASPPVTAKPAAVLRDAIGREGCTALANRSGVSTSMIYTLIRLNRWPRQIRVKKALGGALGVEIP